MTIVIIFTVFLCIASVLTFIMYGSDKKKAKRKQWRIQEKVLLGLGFLGGAVGALAGMHAFRHKTKHWYFWAVNILGLAWQCALFIFLFWKAM